MKEQGLTISQDKIDEYLLARKASGLSDNTIQSYRVKLNLIYNSLPADDKAIYPDSINSIVNTLHEQGYSNQALNVLLAVADGYVTYYKRPDLQSLSRMGREEQTQPEITRTEYLRLLSTAKILDKEREYLIIKVIVLTGLSVSELIAITVEDVQSGWLVSGDEKRRIPDSLKSELMQYTKRNGINSGILFRNNGDASISRTWATKMISALAKPARVDEKKCNPRCLRRLYQDTQNQLREKIQSLVDQAYERVIEREQRVSGV